MPVVTPWPFIAASTILTALFLACSFSRTNPTQLGLLVSMGAVCHVLAALYWRYVQQALTLYGGEVVFRVGGDPFLSAVVFYFCMALTVTMLGLGLFSMLGMKRHSWRTRICLSMAALILALSSGTTATSPWRTQNDIDEMSSLAP